MAYEPPQPITEREFDDALRHLESGDTIENRTALRIHESLKQSNAFTIQYEKTAEHHRARFALGDGSEIVRAVIDTTFRVSPKRIDRTDWPRYLLQEFNERFGSKAEAGNAMTNWCVKNPDRVDELISWLIRQSDDGNHIDLMSLSIKELLVEANRSPESGNENRRRLALHFVRERDASIPIGKKLKFERDNGYLGCEVCGLKADQALDKAMIECHHLVPLGTQDAAVKTDLDDLICVCANCHRRIHATADVDQNLRLLKERFRQ